MPDKKKPLHFDFAYDKFYALKHPFSAKCQTFVAGFTQIPHVHDLTHVWYCVGGSYTHQVENESFFCEKGSVIIVPPGTLHDFHVSDDGEVDLFYLDIGYDIFDGCNTDTYINTAANVFLPPFQKELGRDFPYYYKLSPQSQSALEDFISEFTLLYSRPGITRAKILDNLERIFTLPEFALPAQLHSKASSILKNKVLPITQVLSYINENYSRKIYTEELLRISALCQTNFFKLFKQFTRLPSSTYLQNLRTNHARLLMGNTTYSLSFICDVCGFSNPAHMVECCKKYYNRNPKILSKRMDEYYKCNPQAKRHTFDK